MSSQSWSGLDGTVNCRSCWAQNRRHTHYILKGAVCDKQMLPGD
ncbi:ORF051R [Infectious spleen and kidney necrosis virus]|uniref:ORF051R n=3 Tax=Infectious spleen and kidney necrosis virus TaxID=180170 RepID=Q8QUQ9_ISKNN|nr:ORF051R [Infectious spleen and kidney necrosis virus]QOE77189.1 hypothetical protein [Banggai cardinalfish iridovirus]AAL98775.1 ORF051R [Infectious spleen and kidney necrosis virus]QPO16298.1 hypothetical protein [Infectious spleen and kidney necrosis virus]QPO16418.1 hypothetical protein [Infectious spleen and kidney necrosis virus]UUJ75141.1 hypothetical protein [Infectious spleen and kidney necrosis virus]